LLWCDGDHQEKAEELFDMVHEGQSSSMSSRDRDFKDLFHMILDIATEVVFTNELEVFGNDQHEHLGEEAIQEAKEKYHDLFIAFLDSIFAYEPSLGKYEWIENVVQNQNWILEPAEIRRMLYGDVILE
jgi:hypothetical protein